MGHVEGQGGFRHGLSREEILTALAALDVERYRADQIYGWIYAKGETDFEAMTNLSKNLRSRLQDAARAVVGGVFARLRLVLYHAPPRGELL